MNTFFNVCRTIFPLFMKTPNKSKRAGVTAEEHEEHIISILSSLFKNVTNTNGGGKQRERLLSKFTENDHEKVRAAAHSNCLQSWART